MSNGADLPDDVDALKAMLLEARASISQMQQDMAERDLEIEKLKAQIDKYKRMQFGSKSEKLGRVIEELETRLEDLSASRGAAEMLRYVAIAVMLTLPSTPSFALTAQEWPRQAVPARPLHSGDPRRVQGAHQNRRQEIQAHGRAEGLAGAQRTAPGG